MSGITVQQRLQWAMTPATIEYRGRTTSDDNSPAILEAHCLAIVLWLTVNYHAVK